MISTLKVIQLTSAHYTAHCAHAHVKSSGHSRTGRPPLIVLRGPAAIHLPRLAFRALFVLLCLPHTTALSSAQRCVPNFSPPLPLPLPALTCSLTTRGLVFATVIITTNTTSLH
ncbi:hypothetical protein VOLCADRAFT_92532 [Volvox carteri f. nagariensis]|uniref:Uncharacterized protein n=1 Tax=Volvox carteri f. nagariensis TaxID=3068 RepID=D8TZW9_VOLCA|nr:uncharacterized protein VOLCADRAFT_92532 [Volvox carteri f. nagariensis]EFJ47000.1 hypothetical protein VOLCADRAFT_92532 [Volvox carteri f. nagariensis]|eukprot:XP_002951895.1 hypothetical protein VOLCADRAFT_92532 [Volvox carteri f. nagariensis]